MIYDLFSRSFGNVHHAYREAAGFALRRPEGLKNHTFWHFLSPVSLTTAGETIQVQPGGCYFCQAGQPQYFRSEQELIHDWMHLDDQAARLWRQCGLAFDTLYYPGDSGFITEMVKAIEEEYTARPERWEAMVESLIAQLFIRIARSLRLDDPKERSADAFLSLRRRVLAEPGQQWTVAEMAEQVNLSQSHFYARYRELFGCSPMRDLIDARVAHAKVLLRYSDAPVSRIAEILGYNNPYHFSRQFRDATGLSPQTYRHGKDEPTA